MIEANSNNKTIILLELTEKIQEEGIVISFVKDKTTNNLILSLNHDYGKKKVISPIYKDWIKTTDTFARQMKNKGVKDGHVLELVDILDNNFERIIEYDNVDQGDDYLQQQQKTYYIRKYTGNGEIPLHEAVVINGQPTFIQLGEDNNNKPPQYVPRIERPNRILCPADNIDSLNPLPYIFASAEELEQYLEKAKKETFDTLHFKVKSIFKKYVNAEEHYIVILSADIIYSYFQDRFSTVHYNIFVGDNGSGKNSALLVYRYLGYRVFYVTAASAPNYFTFLGEIEEGQGTIAEDEAEDIAHDNEKRRILKTGYASGGSVPKVDLSNGRTQGSYLTYCMKWFALEELPDYKKVKGVLDRAFVYKFIVGEVEYNIKDVIKYAGDPKFKPLHDDLIDMRKLLFAFRMIHHNNIIPDVNLNIKHRSAELTKPLLRLYSSLNNAPAAAVEEIRLALSKFVSERNELKKNSIESKLYEAINNLIKRREEKNAESDEYKDLPKYGFYNEQIYTEVKEVMDGKDVPFRSESFYSIESGSFSHKHITSILKSKFKAEAFRIGSGSGTKRGLKFSKEVLDRLVTYYDVPDKIEILQGSISNNVSDHTGASAQPQNVNDSNSNNGETNATHATDATHSGDKQGSNEGSLESKNNNCIQENIIKNTNALKSYNIPLYQNTATTITIDNQNQNNIINTHTPLSKSVATVASVADIKNTSYSPAITTNTIAPIVIRSQQAEKVKNEAERLGLPDIPCAFCSYQHYIEFDLGNHLLEKHKLELLKLPIGEGYSIEYRIKCVIELAKRKVAEDLATNEEAKDE